MEKSRIVRHIAIALVLALGVLWSFASAEDEGGYPEAGILATADWLEQHRDSPGVVVVDVREDKHFDGEVIPGAVRLPWKSFIESVPARNVGGIFVGTERAQEILGRHGIARTDTVVLYDSVKRDGGATSSYVFWVLDVLGHEKIKVLERGIDSWKEAGLELAREARKPETLTYQAPTDEIRLRRWADAAFVQERLGDPYYQILDVRSREEYLGEKQNTALDGTPLKAGHIPGAYNVNYQSAWTDKDTKAIKPYRELQALFAGLDPDRAVVTYCHSARRASFGYFILRLMGFSDAIVYDGSWYEWGSPRLYHPVETAENPLPAGPPPGASRSASAPRYSGQGGSGSSGGATGSGSSSGGGSGGGSGGYVSCGG